MHTVTCTGSAMTYANDIFLCDLYMQYESLSYASDIVQKMSVCIHIQNTCASLCSTAALPHHSNGLMGPESRRTYSTGGEPAMLDLHHSPQCSGMSKKKEELVRPLLLSDTSSYLSSTSELV